MKKILFVLALFSGSVMADSSTGCGLGSVIWKENSIVSATFRATTNHSFSSQLFGITSGTSNCTKHSIVKREMAPQYYVDANFEMLKVEMAQGKGEYLDAFAATLGCPLTSQGEFNAATQANYEKIMSGKTSSELLKEVKGVIRSDINLKTQCPYALI